ncbi:MAG: metal-sulfur cluster assembly factor [Candidatus Diapherotrites archaeon]|nr:metal-sulfur cluster assembly factor [Candidatus Diapherotrites archaeon]
MLEEKIKESIKAVVDPELNLSIVDLGLVYEIREENGNAFVKMTFTSPMCPAGPLILSNVKKNVLEVAGVKDVKIDLTFNPPWSPKMASEEIKAMFAEYM